MTEKDVFVENADEQLAREQVELETIRSRVVRFINVFGWEDFACAAFVAAVTIVLQFIWAFPDIHPAHWPWASLATLQRPPEGPVHGLWSAISVFSCVKFGVAGGLVILKLLGHLSIGLLSATVYYFLRFAFAQRLAMPPEELSPCVMRLRFVTVAAALVFSCSDFVWRQGQFFSAELFPILLSALAVICYLQFLKRGRLAWYGLAYAFAGILSAETPIGILMALGFFVISIFNRLRRYVPFHTELLDRDPRNDEFGDGLNIKDIDDEVVRETNQVTSSLENWSFCVFYFMPLFLTMLVDGWLFVKFGGMEVKHLGNWDYPMIFVSSWIGSVRNTISVDDILIATALMFLPFLVAFLLMPLATDSKSRMAFPVGWLIVLLGLGAETQLGPWSPFWYWSWGGRETSLAPGSIQILFAYFGTAAVLGGLIVVTCASRKRKLGVDTLLVAETWLHARLRQFGSVLVVVLTLALVGVSVWGRRLPFLSARLKTLGEYVRMQARHAAGTRWLFTDGSFDDALRVAFKRLDAPTRPISVLSGHLPYEVYLRRIEAQDIEDIPMLEASGSEALRFWVSEKPSHLADSSVQVGYKTLNKAKGVHPRTAGTALRVVRSSDDLAAFTRADAETRAFSQFVLKLLKMKNPVSGDFDLAVNKKFDFMIWRLARLADQRARFCSNAGDAEGARIDHEISAELDKSNASLKSLATVLERLRPTEGVILTPREGLHIALRRADFELARRYAEMVMRVDPEDEQANFATGMWALETQDYPKAARHFEAAIKRNPKDPTLFNNAALAYFKSKFYSDALLFAEKALELKPDSEATKRMIEDIRKEAENPPAESAPKPIKPKKKPASRPEL